MNIKNLIILIKKCNEVVDKWLKYIFLPIAKKNKYLLKIFLFILDNKILLICIKALIKFIMLCIIYLYFKK